MSSPEGLTGEQLAQVFPFHFSVDQKMRVLRRGRSLEKLCPGLVPGALLSDHLRIIAPNHLRLDFEALRQSGDLLLVLKTRGEHKLRGQLLGSEDRLLFLGTPWLPSQEELRQSGLSFRDFAIHDPTLDFLFHLQTQQLTLADLRELSTRYEERSKTLQQAQHQAQEQLRQIQHSEALLQSVLQIAQDAILLLDPAGVIEAANPATERIFRWPVAELLGQPLTVLIPGEGPDTSTPRSNLPDRGRESTGRRQDGSWFPIWVSTGETSVAGVLRRAAFIQDISERKQQERALVSYTSDLEMTKINLEHTTQRLREVVSEVEEARTRAEKADVAKSAFLATMSHEIRTPMNAVMGMTNLLLDTPLSEEQREYVELLQTSGDALLTLLNDILDFSKIESGHLTLENEPFDPLLLIEETIDLISPQASARGLEIFALFQPEVPALIRGDATRLRQVLLNLLSNAIKFTPAGHIEVACGCSSPQGASPEFWLAVRDTGIGIPLEKQDRLFLPFSQADSSITREYGGTGLGLAICRRLVSLMGGQIGLLSEAGQGSTFEVHLPLDAAPEPRAQPFQGYQMAVVEESEPGRRAAALALRRWGATVQTYRHAEALMDGPRPDAILLGYSATLALAGALPPLPTGVPTLLILPRTLRLPPPSSVPQIRRPYRDRTLQQVLASLLRLSHSERPVREQRSAQIPRMGPMRLLLAEDNQVNQKVALKLLAKLGLRADVAANGIEVLAAFERATYDVVLMDLHMPEMDGLTAARTIRERWGDGPRIVAVTASSFEADREACLQAGMNGFVRKPILLAELHEELQRVSERRAP